MAAEPLLAAVRVLDLCDETGDGVTRLLADLGADVIKIEPPGGSPARHARPTLDGVSVPFALHNANKRGTVLDPADDGDRDLFFELAAGADILVDSGTPGLAASFGTSCAELADRFGGLVTMSVTDFGTQGPHASWRATDAVLYAMSSALSRSGPTSGAPVLPPDGIASATAAVQAAWAILVAYFNRLRCGTGDYIDFSRFDAVVLTLDPPFGTQGQAATARNAAERWRGRPRNQDSYPIFACRDGYVRLCVLAPRQWHGMRAWLGEPEQFQDPRFDSIAARTRAFSELSQLMAALFADRTMKQLVAEGQAHGVPIAAVLTPSQALGSEHLAEVGALADTDLAPGVAARVPVGYWVVDGAHAGYRTPAPALDFTDKRWQSAQFTPGATGSVGARPLEGIRVLDLGVIVAGGELSRLFADLGAEVIKVESSSYPDGLRQKGPDQQISESFARAHRNNLGLGLELRSPAGAEVFSRLVSASDAVFANFKPGTLPALGFSYERLQELNPGLVLAESSAFGDTGPWSKRMGYGPLVRATIGVTRLWTSQEPPPPGARHAFYDATTIFPDHVVGRISAIGALAGLIRRERDGVGARLHVSQAEAVINQLDTLYVTLAAAATGAERVEPDPTESLVLPCAGDDEWCVVSIRSAADQEAIASVIGRSELAAWLAERSPLAAAEALQAAGVAAGPMYRATDLHDDPQLRSRNVFADMAHPLFDAPLPTESGPAPYRHIPPAPQRPAPLPGADTRRVCADVLGMTGDDIDKLIADGVLFAPAGDTETTGVTR
ncbi:crotonobetainyl-CoA:carnitine CoA-transferase CaiB-like acyl-CoA transferase [Mycolicibacterium sp. BK634]|uniref:CaiB/BaiF CoA transferase family protein n=1 Tax=Mycolicibacterium sp. BK634 TaxID=2587099 RepID=UPI00160F109F|nr:crotonobetainyl-CoA:carnitine CoA-transferase CaiB-like acyl-CoA transferase [Mycolicibacterium sp. BK634]